MRGRKMRMVSRINEFRGELERNIEQKLWKAGFYVEGDAKRMVPVDTGNLRSSIHTTVSNLTATIGSKVFYAPFVELGTVKMYPRPYLRPAFENNRSKIASLFNAGSI